MRINRATVTFVATLLVAAGLVVWVIQRTDRRAAADAVRVGWQEADVPRWDDGAVHDPWLDPPDAWSDSAAPLVDAVGPVTDGDAAPGSPVYAAANGIVWFAGARDGTRAVVLSHRDVTGRHFESIHAPLASVAVKPGDLVGRGMVVGTLGEEPPGPVFPDLPDGVAQVDGGRSVLAEALETPDPDPWMWLEIENAGKFLDLMDVPDDADH